MPSQPDTELAEKLSFLQRADAYPDHPAVVEPIETHFAWVFVSRQFVYKLKKPVHLPDLDLTTLAARRANCELEVALNRRLARDSYIGVVALGRDGAQFRLGLERNVADWLVKMVRLPRRHTLEQRLPAIDVDDPQLEQLISTLCAFYARAARPPLDAERYRESLTTQCARAAERLCLPMLEAAHSRVRAVAKQQAEWIDRHSATLRQRITERRICDTHGDLRPEHIFLLTPPQIIDCLEFSAELRRLDAAEEISFLQLECQRLGRADVGERLRALYQAACDDDASAALFAFYRSRRALVRAYLSIWHVTGDGDDRDSEHWLNQTLWYIAAAEQNIAAAATSSARRDA